MAAVARGLGGLRHGAGYRQQRQEGEERDYRQVLEQQHAECALPHRTLPQTFLFQALQDDGGGRHGQDEAEG